MTGRTDEHVHVFDNLEAASRAAAKFFVSVAVKKIAEQGRGSIVLSGGSTPKLFYSLLASAPYRDAVSWRDLHFFWADERCVPPTHPESNFKLAFDTLFSKISAPQKNIHRIRGEEEPAEAARRYEQDIIQFFGRSAPRFDLALLGAGEDGHTASLFPDSPALQETGRLACPVYLEPQKRNRVTLTLTALNNAGEVLFLASGNSKAEVVSTVLEGGNAAHYPAGLIRPLHGEVVWMIDREAGSRLKRIKV